MPMQVQIKNKNWTTLSDNLRPRKPLPLLNSLGIFLFNVDLSEDYKLLLLLIWTHILDLSGCRCNFDGCSAVLRRRSLGRLWGFDSLRYICSVVEGLERYWEGAEFSFGCVVKLWGNWALNSPLLLIRDANEVVMMTTLDQNLTDWCDISTVMLWTPGLSVLRHTYAPSSIVSVISFYMCKSECAGAS